MKKSLLGVSLFTLTCLYGMLAAVIIAVCLFTGLPVMGGIVLSIIILILQFLVAPFFTDLSMKWFYKANFDYNMPDYLKNFITEVCNKYNMKFPRIGYIDDGAPNAFTYGRTKNDARVVLTRGIFELLTEEEVKAVVAHELGHATHYDMLFMTFAQLVPLILYGIFDFLSNASDSSSDDDSSKTAAIALIAYVLYIVSQYIILWLSRTREYYADSYAIEETRNPSALASALVKVGYGLSINSGKTGKSVSASKSNALGIFDSKTSKSLVVSSYDDGQVSKENIVGAMKWEMWNVWAKWYEISSTHPLISKRLIAISNRSAEFGQQPYIAFNETKPESYVDDFFYELFISILPILAIALGVAGCMLLSINDGSKVVGICGILLVLALFVQLGKTHKNSGYQPTNVASLLSEVKVSGITSIPCILEGNIIGRGNPGCIFNEDFVLKDETGIIFLDYNQPLVMLNKLFALFKSKEYFDKKVKIIGWYRRSPVPYVEIYSMEVDGKVKKCHTYGFTKIVYILLILVFIALISM